MAEVKGGSQALSFQRFSTACGVDVAKIQPRYAVGPGSSFTPVKNLAQGLRSLDTDFYSTVEAWTSDHRVLIEMWANSDDVGSEVRYFECFANGKLTQAEVIDWNLPLVKGPGLGAWGYSRRWERGSNGRLQRTKAEFVDGMEQPVPTPKLDEDDKKSLLWITPLGPLSELKLPPSTLR
jgi:hypothetical protein